MKTAKHKSTHINYKAGSMEGKMKGVHLALVVALSAIVSVGCTNVERSRDLNNASVPASVTALQVCSNCHGVDGNPKSPNFPRLAGQQEDYFILQLKNFRSHHRSDPEGYQYMWGLSRNLTDEQIAGLAKYYAKQTPRRSEAAQDPTLIATGKEIFEKGVPDQNVIACMACHGEKAQGIGAFPRLANQYANYVEKQLDVFQNTQGRPGTAMEFVVHPLTGPHKQAIAAYLQAFPE